MNKSIHDRTKELVRLVIQLCYNNVHIKSLVLHRCSLQTFHIQPTVFIKLSHSSLPVNMNHWTVQIVIALNQILIKGIQ
jgi:hypothetical protein